MTLRSSLQLLWTLMNRAESPVSGLRVIRAVTVVILSTAIVYGNLSSGELSVKKPSGYW
jgi:hypothetical protein